MSGDTVTQTVMSGVRPGSEARPAPAPASSRTAPASIGPVLAPSRAARELGLKRGEFDLAVRLGRIRTVPDEGGGGGRRVNRTEIERVRSEPGFPEALRERVKAVGTSEGAALMGITTGRFTRFARLGLIVPIKFYLNRYRAVVWLYLAVDLKRFAADEANKSLLENRLPEGLRGQLDTGLDLRARNWRGRYLGCLLRQTEDPWERAAAVASLLDPAQVAEIVTDPYERAHLNRHRLDEGARGAPDSPAARITARIMTAEDPDEISWLRADLANGLDEARSHRPAPRPMAEPEARPGSHEVRHLVRHDVPAVSAGHRAPTGRRRPVTPRRPVELRKHIDPRRPADRHFSTDQRRPIDRKHPADPWRPTARRRPATALRAAEAPHPVGPERAVGTARHTVDEPERPGCLLGWLRRRNS